MIPYDPNCSMCPLGEPARRAGKHACVPGVGPLSAPIALYGEAPGATEETENKPFVGQAGALLDYVLKQAGLSRDEVWISNAAARCRPPYNRSPGPEEMNACRRYTLWELDEVRPQIIVALGASALRALTGQSVVGTNRGKVLHLKNEYRSPIPCIVTYHPASVLHNPQRRDLNLEAMVSDLRFAQRLLAMRGDDSATFMAGSTKVRIATSTETREALRTIYNDARGAVASDGEWSVINDSCKWPWSRWHGEHNELYAVGVAAFVDDAKKEILAVSVPIGHGDPALERAMQRILQRHPSIYHQAAADLVWYLARGWQPILGGDTLLLGSLLNLDSGLSLEAMASLLTDMPPGWKDEVRSELIGRVPVGAEQWARTLDYNARDCVATLMLHEAALARVHDGREKLLTLYERVLLPATYALARAALLGAPIDMAYLGRLERSARHRMNTLVQEAADLLGIHARVEEVLLNKNRLGYVLKGVGADLPPTEKTGAPSVTIDTLTQNAHVHPAIPKLVTVAKLQKLHGTYFAPWQRMLLEQGDARLHTLYKLHQARTGRSSGEVEQGGTLQQAPHAAMIRRVVRAAPGWRLMSADFSMIEVRIAAWFANERTLLRFLNEGLDIHKATAGWLKAASEGVTLDSFMRNLDKHLAMVTPDERYEAKPPNFGLLFGGTESVLIRLARQNYGITLTPERAKMMRDGYFELYPDLLTWHAENAPPVPYVETPTGRRRYIDDSAETDPTAGQRKRVNTPVQSFATDLALMAGIVDMGDALVREEIADLARLVGFVHDEVIYEYEPTVEQRLREIAVDCMEHPKTQELFGFTIPVPIKVDVECGEFWS